MTTPKKEANGQEQIAGAFAAFLFFIPVFMSKKTDFTLFYMRQNFLLILVVLILSLLGKLVPVLVGLTAFVNIIIFFLMAFLAWKAYSWEKFALPYLYDASIKVIKTFKLDTFFSIK